MVSSRTLLIACGVGTLVLGACGSSSPSPKGGTSTTIKNGLGTTPSTTPFTTQVGSSPTVSPVTSGTVSSGQTTAPGSATTIKTTTPTTSASGATTTTAVKGRTVTLPSDNVKAGDKGDGVTKIQFALKAAGYKVTVDGTFGNQTDAAVRLFQKKVGLKVDGIVGKVTWAKLSAASPGSATVTTVKGTTATTVKGTTATTVKGTTATTVKAGTTTTTGVK